MPLYPWILVFAALSALLHVYIFWMESIAWTTPRVRRTFGTSEADARATKELAFNQGFYNLFLAIAAGAGIAAVLAGSPDLGLVLILTGTGMMLAAALVLLISSPSKAKAAITQGLFPLVTVALVIVAFLTRAS